LFYFLSYFELRTT